MRFRSSLVAETEEAAHESAKMITLLRTSAIVVLALIVGPLAVPAKKDALAHQPTPYNPYPPGILPADLEPEIEQGPPRNQLHLPASSRRVARITASEPDRATANAAGQRLCRW